jgi:hypothetical protein
MEEEKVNTYTPSQKNATQKWRENNRAKYNKTCNDYYHRCMQNPELRRQHNERCLKNNRKYQQKKKLEKMEAENEKKEKLTASIKVVAINHSE